MTPEQAAALRAAFPPETVGKLPSVWCKGCRDANKERRGSTCSEHQRRKCDECGNNMTSAHLHLDYVGHAATTDRLLQVDPEWTWEPAAVNQFGAPALSDGGLWIRLTVGGVTRLGYGDGDSIKVMIGDAIRNAAMRFGVALDLWSKEDLQAGGDVEAAGAPEQPSDRGTKVGVLAESGTGRPNGDPRSSQPAASTAISQGRATTRETTGSPSEGAAVPPAAAAAPVLPVSTIETLQSRVSAYNAGKRKGDRSIADERTQKGLPPLHQVTSLDEVQGWDALMSELEQWPVLA